MTKRAGGLRCKTCGKSRGGATGRMCDECRRRIPEPPRFDSSAPGALLDLVRSLELTFLREEPAGTLRVGHSWILLDAVIRELQRGRAPYEILRTYATLALPDIQGVARLLQHYPTAVQKYVERRRETFSAWWEEGARSITLLDILQENADPRDLRRFCCVAVRRLGSHLLLDRLSLDRLLYLVELCERRGDLPPLDHREEARELAWRLVRDLRESAPIGEDMPLVLETQKALHALVSPKASVAARAVAIHVAAVAARRGAKRADPADRAAWMEAKEAGRAAEMRAQGALLQCIFRNPTLSPLTFEPAVLTRNDGAARKLAHRRLPAV